MLIQINDTVYKDNDARLSALNLGFNRGHAVFDFFRFNKGKIRFYEDHMDRLFNSIALSGISILSSRETIQERIISLIEKSKIEVGCVRITVSAGASENFSSPSSDPDIIIAVYPFSAQDKSLYDNGARLISKEYKRDIPRIKTTNYFFAQMYRKEMLSQNAVDILYYDDYIRETSRANIFLVKGKTIYTPESEILAGVTRKNVLRLFPDIIEKDITIGELLDYDEIFITSSSRDVLPIIAIDGKAIGDGSVGSITKEVIESFQSYIGIAG